MDDPAPSGAAARDAAGPDTAPHRRRVRCASPHGGHRSPARASDGASARAPSPATPDSTHALDEPARPAAPQEPRPPAPSLCNSPPPMPRDAPRESPAALLPLLRCPLCAPPRLLHEPRTLRCGHTVCAAHLAPAAPRCPIPTCTAPAPPAPPTPHPAAPVRVVPVAAAPQDAPDVDTPHARAHDVTVGKVLALLQRAQAAEDAAARVRAYDDDDGERTESDAGSEREDPTDGLYADPSPERPTASASAHPDAHPRPRSPADSPGRPRKRRRRMRAPRPRSPRRAPHVDFEKELLAELTCEICFALLVQPLTTPCQHTFCAGCLHRALDHSRACPLCRAPLPDYAFFAEHPPNRVLLALVLRAFPGAYEERRAALAAEERDARLDTPVFVCQLSFPGMPTWLHLFEPRYRLMLRRCLATPNPRFGMIPPPRNPTSAAHAAPPFLSAAPPSAPASSSRPVPAPAAPPHVPPSAGNEYGTMLEIRSVQMLPDGRAVVETWGAWRFRIVERGTRDGYVVARVERVDDFVEDEDGDGAGAGASGDGERRGEGGGERGGGEGAVVRRRARGRTNAELMATCHTFLRELREGTPWVVNQLSQVHVPMPADPGAFSFWMGALLPIDEHEKAKLLPIRSARLRLRLVVHWIEQLQSNWARSYASASRLQVVLWWLRRLLMRTLLAGTLPYAFVVALVAVYVAQALVLGAEHAS